MAKLKKTVKKAARKVSKATKKAAGKIVKKKIPKKAAKKAPKKKSRKKNNELMCYLTSACVDHYNLADDCFELQTLRSYRDNYLLSTDRGKTLVADYYKIAPAIVSRIQSDSNKIKTYEYIFSVIKQACSLILVGELKAVQVVYTDMVKRLARKYPSV